MVGCERDNSKWVSMHARYNKTVEAVIGQVLVVGMVVLGFVQDLSPPVVIGATVGLALLTIFKVYWVSNGVARPATETQPGVVGSDAHDSAVASSASDSRIAESWREEGPGRHQRARSSYRGVTEVAPATPRAVSRIREDASEI